MISQAAVKHDRWPVGSQWLWPAFGIAQTRPRCPGTVIDANVIRSLPDGPRSFTATARAPAVLAPALLMDSALLSLLGAFVLSLIGLFAFI